MKNVIIIIIILASNTILFGQKRSVGDDVYVIAEGGLNLREQPKPDGKIISVLSKGSKLKIEQVIETEELKLSNHYKGKWVYISYDNQKGYVFDTYISKLKPIEFLEKDENGCWRNDILKDLATAIGKLDSIEYDNFADGEGTYRMIIFPLNNGDKYVEHYYWEHLENEIQLSKLRKEEIDQFVRSIIQYCKEDKIPLDIVGEGSRDYIDIRIDNDCCMHELQIKIINDTLIIRTQIDAGT